MSARFAALVLAMAAVVVVVVAPAEVAGFPSQEVAILLLYGAALLWLTGWAVDRARPSGREAVGALAMWVVFVAAATSLYVGRESAIARLREIAEDAGVGGSPTLVVSGGEVSVTRRGDGSFLIPARINDRPATFVFDTGATSVVLMNETARALGFPADKLAFRVPVLTANGRTLAAPVTLERLAIGSIVLSRVSALVSQPGALHQNLLGGSVLDRLDSYEVRGNRLVLRARTG